MNLKVIVERDYEGHRQREQKDIHDENKSPKAIPRDVSSGEEALYIQNMDQRVKIKDLIDENNSIHVEYNSIKVMLRGQ